MLGLLSSLYAAIERAFTIRTLKPQILTSPNGAGLLCDNAEDAICLASLVASALSTAVTVGLDHGYVDDCHTRVMGKDIVVMVSDSINYAARLAFADNEKGSILASCSFAESLRRVNAYYATCVSEVKTSRVKQTPLEYRVVEQAAVLSHLGITPEPNIPTPTRQGGSGKYGGNAHVLLIDIVGFTRLPAEQMKGAIQKLWNKIGETAEELFESLPQYVGSGDGVAFVSLDLQGYRLFVFAEETMRAALNENLRLHAALDYGPIATLPLPDNRRMILGPPIIDADDASHKVEPGSIALTDRFRRTPRPTLQTHMLSRGTPVAPMGTTVVLQISKSHDFYTLAQILEKLDNHNAQHVWVFSESLLILHGQVGEQQKMAYAILDRLMTHPSRNYRYVQFAERQPQLTACRELFEQVKLANPQFVTIDLGTRIRFGVIPNACRKRCAAQKLVTATSPHVVLWQGQNSGGRNETRGFGAMTVTSRTESQLSAGWIYLDRPEAEGLSRWLHEKAGITYI